MKRSTEWPSQRRAECEHFMLCSLQGVLEEFPIDEIDAYADHLASCSVCREALTALDIINGIPGIDYATGCPELGIKSNDDLWQEIEAARKRSLAEPASTATVPALNGQQQLLTDTQCQSLQRLLNEEGIRSAGHVTFTAGCRTGIYFEFGKLVESPRWSEFMELCVAALKTPLQASGAEVIVGHTAAMYAVGNELAKHAGITPRSVVAAYGNVPVTVPGVAGEYAGKRVALLLDVVLSGDTRQSIIDHLQHDLRAKVVYSACIVYQGQSAIPGLDALLVKPSTSYLHPCLACAIGDVPKAYNPTLGRLRTGRTRLEHERAWKQHVQEHGGWWDVFADAKALKVDREFGGRRYGIFIETNALLAHETARKAVAKATLKALAPIEGNSDITILFERMTGSTRSERMAVFIQELTGWKLVPFTSRDSKHQLKTSSAEELRGRHVLIVDAAVNTGNLARRLHQAAMQSGASTVSVFAFVNRLAASDEEEVFTRFLKETSGGHFLYCFPLPVRAPRIPLAAQGTPSRFRDYAQRLAVYEQYRKYWLTLSHQSGFYSDAQEEVESSRAVWEQSGNADHVHVMRGELTEKQMKSRVKRIPKQWLQESDVRSALSTAMSNGFSPRAKGFIARFLVDNHSYEWLDNEWIKLNHRLFNDEPTGAVFGVGVYAAICERPDLRPGIRRDLESSIQLRSKELLFPEIELSRASDLGLARLQALLSECEEYEHAGK